MPDILRVTQAVNPKDYTMPTKPIAESNAIFNIADLTKIVKTSDRTEQFKHGNDLNLNSGGSLDSSLKLSKNPSFASDTLRDLLNPELLSLLQQKGADEFASELNSLAKAMFLSSETLVGDIVQQQEGITGFKGDFFVLLREIYSQTQSEDTKQAILSLLRNLSTLQSQNEILNSLTSNFKYLSQNLSLSKSLSEQLFNIAKQFAKPDAAADFQATKHQALEVLRQVESSLLLTDKLKNLIPLITHNLSRFNDNPQAVKANLQNLLALLHGTESGDKLASDFENFVQSSTLTQSAKDFLLSTSQGFADADNLAISFAKQTNLISSQIDKNSLLSVLENLSSTITLAQNASGEASYIPIDNATELLKQMLSTVLPKDARGDIERFMSVFSQTKDLNTLITRLTLILNKIDDADIKSLLAKHMNGVLGGLTSSPEVFYKPPTSLENLVDFLSRNLTNDNARLLGLVDPQALVQNMLISPGVFTPLMHFFMPYEDDDTRAIGELWVDPDGEQSAVETDGEHRHLFLTFDIDKIGAFELELYAREKDLTVSVFCPIEYTRSFSSVKNGIENVAKASGYSIKKTNINSLIKRRDLTEVFPKLMQRRSGLNVKI